jgi:prepilin-type N-terminal cleavage/methylation domain-containing protein
MPFMTTRTRRPRLGFTLAELMVALVLLSVVGTAIINMIVRQQRFYTGASEVIETRSSVRQVADLLPTELRGLSPANGDIDTMGVAGIKFRSLRGATVICNLVSGTQIVIPPLALSRRNGLSSWSMAPVVGDSVMVFDIEANPRRWEYRRIVAVGPGVCLPATNFGANGAENAAGILLTLDAGLPLTMVNGAAIRFFRQASYELYRAANNEWYLGYRDCLPGRVPACETIQPVSGPYLPRGPAATSGLALRYFNLAGAETMNPTDVVRIDVVVRAASRRPIQSFGGGGELYRDSVAFSIAVRN